MKKISRQCKIGFFSTIIWGLFAHGIMLTNKFSWNDDISELFGIGSTVQSGRWMLEIMKTVENFFFGSLMYSAPLFNGVVCILCIATMVALLIDLFEIKNELASISIGGVMVTFPVVTGMFGYMFTAPAYMIGLLMGIVGAYLCCKYKKWYTYVIALVLCACCVGTYQAFIPMVISTFVIFMIKSNVENSGRTFVEIVKEAMYYIVFCIGFMALYLFINNKALEHYEVVLLGYSGINTMGMTSISGYLQRIVLAYQEFFVPNPSSSANMFPMGIAFFYRLVLLFIVLISVLFVCRIAKKNILNAIYIGLLVVVLPLATNFIYFMCDSTSIHSLTVYGKVFVLVYFIWLLDQFDLSESRWKQYVAKGGLIIAIIISIMYCRFDNICYLKAEMLQSQAVHYFTSLVAQIKSVDGYADELPVVFVNEKKIADSTVTYIPEFDAVHIIPYAGDTRGLLNNYVWKNYMKRWVGYSPAMIHENIFSGNEEVMNMPSYPDDGSIKVINGMVVVKF